MDVVVIGLGLIGGSMAKDLRRAGFATGLVGVESDPEHAAEAVRLGIVDRVESLEEALPGADLVLITTPVDVAVTLLPGVLDRVGRTPR